MRLKLRRGAPRESWVESRSPGRRLAATIRQAAQTVFMRMLRASYWRIGPSPCSPA